MLNPLHIKWVLWNVFLALVPVGLAYGVERVMSGKDSRGARLVVASAIAIVWLVFMPNTCYLLTEWRHFLEKLHVTGMNVRWQSDSRDALTLMVDTLVYLCYSGVGVLCFAAAIRPVARTVRRLGMSPSVCAIPFFLLMSLGVYLGLILRFNSWDFLNRASDIWGAVLGLLDRPTLSLAVIGFAAFLWVVYWCADVWIDGWISRFRKTTVE